MYRSGHAGDTRSERAGAGGSRQFGGSAPLLRGCMEAFVDVPFEAMLIEHGELDVALGRQEV